MTIIYIQPKAINLRQFEFDNDVSGLHISNVGGQMLVEADMDEDVLLYAIEAHEADPDFVHPDDVARQAEREASAIAKKQLVDSAKAKLSAMYKKAGLTDDEIAALST